MLIVLIADVYLIYATYSIDISIKYSCTSFNSIQSNRNKIRKYSYWIAVCCYLIWIKMDKFNQNSITNYFISKFVPASFRPYSNDMQLPLNDCRKFVKIVWNTRKYIRYATYNSSRSSFIQWTNPFAIVRYSILFFWCGCAVMVLVGGVSNSFWQSIRCCNKQLRQLIGYIYGILPEWNENTIFQCHRQSASIHFMKTIWRHQFRWHRCQRTNRKTTLYL